MLLFAGSPASAAPHFCLHDLHACTACGQSTDDRSLDLMRSCWFVHQLTQRVPVYMPSLAMQCYAGRLRSFGLNNAPLMRLLLAGALHQLPAPSGLRPS